MERLRKFAERAVRRLTRPQDERDAALRALSLEQADRAAALVLGEPPILPLDENTTTGELHPYTAAFLRQHQNNLAGFDGVHAFAFDETVRQRVAPEGRIVVAAVADPLDGELRWTTTAGALEVREEHELPAPRRTLPSIAHAALDMTLRYEEVRALARDPDAWSPTPALHPPRRVDPTPDHLVLDDRSRAWALVGSLVLLGLGTSTALLCAARLADPFMWAALPFAILSGPMALTSTRRLAEVLWLEPRARRLALDDEGLRHPKTGAPIAWRNCRAVENGSWNVTITLPDGVRVSIPRNTFLRADEAFFFLRARVGRPGGPFRQAA